MWQCHIFKRNLYIVLLYFSKEDQNDKTLCEKFIFLISIKTNQLKFKYLIMDKYYNIIQVKKKTVLENKVRRLVRNCIQRFL